MTRKQIFLVIFRVNSSTVVTIRGLKATEEGKPASVKVSFKVKKTGKASKYSYVSKVNVIEEKQEPAILTATQTGVKAVTVTTNFDATNSKISLSKGSAAVEEKHTVSADGMTITFNTTASIVAATYTVKVDDLTKDFDGEVSKTAEIQFLSDKAALEKISVDKDKSTYHGACVGYRVVNQFGDDITKNVTLNETGNCEVKLSPSTNMIHFVTDSQNGFMLGRDLITVSLLDTSSNVSKTATLTVSAEAYASDITFEGVYNVDNKELTEDTILANDNFYVLFSIKDQYGNKFSNYKGIKDGTDLYLTVIGGLTGLAKDESTKDFIVVSKDGTDYLAFPLAWSTGITKSAGTATVQVLSAGGGSCTGEIVIGEGGRVDTITVSQNGVIVAGEENEVSYTALDASGKEVTSYKYLKDVKITQANGDYTLSFRRKDDGSAKLVLDATNADVTKGNTTMLSYSFQTQNNKFSNVLLKVSENARPVAIDGLRDVDTTLSSKTEYVDIKIKNLVIEDQYGRVLPAGQVAGMAASQDADAYNLKTISAKVSDGTTNIVRLTTGSAATISGAAFTVTPGAAVNKETVLFQVEPKAKGTKVVTFSITNGASTKSDMLADATTDVNFIVRDTTASTVAKAEVGSIYVVTGSASTPGAVYKQDVKVKVGSTLLSYDDYTVSVPGGMAVTESSIGGTKVWAVYSSANQQDIKEFKEQTATTLTRTITITLNGSGEQFTQDVTLDRTAPKITTVSDLSDRIKPVSGSVISGASLFAGTGVTDPKQKPVRLDRGWIGDQYGKGVIDNADGTFTLADGTVVTPSYNFVCTVPYGEGAGAPNDLKDNNKTTAELEVGNGFAGATLTIDFGGKVATVIVFGN